MIRLCESVWACITVARENARQKCEQISSEMWEQINRLYWQVRPTSRGLTGTAQPRETLGPITSGRRRLS